METLECIRTRTSVRKFKDKEVPDELIKKVLTAGLQSPSGGNRQPWRFIVVKDRDKIKQFDDQFSQHHVLTAPAVIIACANPHDTWEKYDEDDQCWIMDVSAAVQNILLAIHDLDLGATWTLSCGKHKIRELVGIPKHWQILSIIPFGYPAEHNKPRPRKDISDIAFMENTEAPFK